MGGAVPHDGRAMTEFRTTPRAPLPMLRAAVFAVVGTVLGVSAHHLVAEGPVPWRPGAVGAAVLFAVGLVGVRRPRSLPAVLGACGAAQAGLHVWLAITHAHTAVLGSMPSHAHHHTGAHGAWHERLHGSPAMTAVHVLSAVLVAVLLHRADAVFWSLARGLTTAVETVRAWMTTVRVLLSGAASEETGLPQVAVSWLERPPLTGTVLTDVVVRRGPPRAGLTLAN